MLGIYFGGQNFKARFGNDYGNIEIDAQLEETHEWTSEVTSNPVEYGSPIADHILEQPDKLTFRCFITDSPIIASQTVTQQMVDTPEAGMRTQPVFDLLYDLKQRRDLLTVYTKHRIYDNMVIARVTVPRKPGDGEAFEFDVEFVNIRLVGTQLVEVPKGIGRNTGAGMANKVSAKKDAGKTQTEPVKRPSSTLSRVFAK